ncbi:response regulator [Geobacter sp. FeAm09]|uniref:response regulator n=1 Tax=Geobacter sp. FeAm09 TaxID=2597769 RepID=UPI0011EDAFDC|nr:response regulator [Geobacter sp. FeAm09]QEM67628.1 response regulator [Geobacter sp. FeAm09]
MQQWKKLGQILVEKGILTPLSVERLLAVAKRRQNRFGWTLEDMGLVTGDELAGALAEQFGLKRVSNLASYSYSQEVLGVVTPEFALQHLVFPLKLEGKKLALAVADPTDMKVVDNFAVNNGLQIIPCVASRRHIYEAVSTFYLGKSVQEPQQVTVLVVDDDVVTQTVLKDILARQGYRVVVANDGMEGFKEVIATKPHLIIVDKVMPKLDGFALLKSLKAIPEIRTIPVVLISDKMSDEDEARVFTMGFFDYVPKPVKEITLVSRVKRALGDAGAEGDA